MFGPYLHVMDYIIVFKPHATQQRKQLVWSVWVTHPLARESLHLFQHFWPMLRPFTLDHFHYDSWKGIFDVALLLQDRMSTLMRVETGITRVSYKISDNSIFVTVTLTFDNSCMAQSFKWTFSCWGMSFHRNLEETNQHFYSLEFWCKKHAVVRSAWLCYTHLMTCSRIWRPKCLTTAVWVFSANCKPQGTQNKLVSLKSSQYCSEIK